ncbi:unnamed protein product, partial [Brassica rapa]
GRASVLSPRTSVLICVLKDSHGRPVCADGHTQTATDIMCVLTDSHRQPQTSCVCWRTPTDVMCVLNRQPTWAKITQTVHGQGQRAESKDQHADMCTDGQPRTSCCADGHRLTHTDSNERPVCAGGHPQTSSTDVLCVLTDTDIHTRTHTDTHRRHVCAGGHPRTSCVY